MSTTMTHPSCDCDDTDVDTTYRMCCSTVGNSPSFSAATLFDTGAHTSFVNREVAAWIELQAKGDKGYAKRRRLGPETAAASVSLAGTSHNSAILGSVVFDLTYLNEVTQSHETIRNIHAQVLDSCIAVIITQVIRENHLVQRYLFTSMSSPALDPTRARQCCQRQHYQQRERGVVARSLVLHAPPL